MRAQEVMNRAFEVEDSFWRGVGIIRSSGLFLREEFKGRDARVKYHIHLEPQPEEDIPPGCSCGQILLGKRVPTDCPLFGTRCTPLNPIGPCMVSGEGTCLIWYKFKRGKKKGG